VKAVDGNDVLVVAGLALVGVGLALVSVPLALCVVGGVLLVAGALGAWRKGTGPGRPKGRGG